MNKEDLILQKLEEIAAQQQEIAAQAARIANLESEVKETRAEGKETQAEVEVKETRAEGKETREELHMMQYTAIYDIAWANKWNGSDYAIYHFLAKHRSIVTNLTRALPAAKIAEAMDCSIKTVRRSLKVLERDGAIQRDLRYKHVYLIPFGIKKADMAQAAEESGIEPAADTEAHGDEPTPF